MYLFLDSKESSTFEMVHGQSPSFFKILLDTSAPHLPLPPDFASRYLENKIPKVPIIQSVSGGYSWRLKIKKIGESFCFFDGWSNVVEDLQLDFGDFLVFRFVDKSIFELAVYSPSGCEKNFPPKFVDDSGTVDDDDDDFAVEDVDEDEVEDEAEDEADDDVVVKNVYDVEEDEVEDEDEDEVEDEDEDEDDDDDDDDDDEVEYEDEKDDGDDEDDGADDDDGGGDIDGDDGDPFFMTTISKSNKNFMRLPPEFVELVGLNGEGTLTLKNLDEKEWQTGLRVEKTCQSERYCISAGWTDFRRSNDISEGEECVFKFITSEEKLLLARVTKKKRPARKPERNADETPATETEVVERRVQPERKSGGAPATKVVERRVQPERNSGGTPATKVVERRVQPERKSGGTPASKVVVRRVQPKRNSGEVPAIEHGGGVRKRGRPRKLRRGKSTPLNKRG